MAIIVALVSQKGGVGKSTLARALAAVAAHGGLAVTLADLDLQQRTSMRWGSARRTKQADVSLTVKLFTDIDAAIASEQEQDLVVVDAPGHTSSATLDIARRAHLIVQPTGPSLDDLHPAVLLFHELLAAGVPRRKLVFALTRVLSEDEESAARAYLVEAGYAALAGSMPERIGYRRALNRGDAPTETNEAELNERVDALMESLIEKVMGELRASQRTEPTRARKGSAA